MGVTAFIPAKMTSQRLPGKNMRLLDGKPLLFYSIRAAQLAQEIDEVVVSSEDAKVLEYAASCGVVTHQRPAELSLPEIRNLDVLRAWHYQADNKPDLLVLMQPTHPLRHPEDIGVAVQRMQKNPADCLFTVIRENLLLGTIEEGYFQPEFPLPRNKKAEPERYRNTGSFYIFRPEASYLQENGSMFGDKILAHPVQRPEFELDIDTYEDYSLLKSMYQAHQEYFSYFQE
ncbi:MAG: acylneuraminate cytidylyltransferase family protein [Candidatus Electrothrix sp. AU1_5]|nr:acylneuraminate cytidylyltransferase family protein [Candidatus Electrothrix gigas]